MSDTWPVVIVGAGPTGLAASIGLAQLGISCRVIDQNDHIVPHPRGHVLNVRTMEILRQWGLEGEVIDRSLTGRAAGRIAWTERLGQDEIGSLHIPPTPDHVSPTRGCSCAQDVLEEVLLKHSLRLGNEVSYGTKMVGLEPGVDGPARVTLADGSALQAQYVIAADGASSGARSALGVEMDGPEYLGSQINITFTADLQRVLGDRLSLLTWVIDPDFSGVLINMGEGRWVYNLGYDARVIDRSDFDESTCQQILDRLVPSEAAPALSSIHAWRMAAQVARSYRVGSSFLCGDAAHRFPPTGGLGANTGIADAHNLVWKLALVLGGESPDGLLDTYERERRPVAQENTQFSLRNARDITSTGIGPSAADVAKVLRAGGPEAEARRAEIQREIQRQSAHFSHLRQDLGYLYGSHAGSTTAATDPTGQDDYQPSLTPGGRFPHTWLEAGRSTLDLVGNRYVLVSRAQNAQCCAQVHDELGSGEVQLLPPEVAEAIGLGEDDAVLVRPDGHIAWRLSLSDPADVRASALAALHDGRCVIDG